MPRRLQRCDGMMKTDELEEGLSEEATIGHGTLRRPTLTVGEASALTGT